MTPINRVLGQAGLTAKAQVEGSAGAVIRVTPEMVGKTLQALKDSDRVYDFLVDLFGIDTGEAVVVVYMVRSFVCDDDVTIRMSLAYGSDLASVWELYPAALMPERECAEMFGLTLSGHPNPKRLLTTEAVPPLLLKTVEVRTPEEVRRR